MRPREAVIERKETAKERFYGVLFPQFTYEYSRGGNPTRTVFETCVAALEGAKYGKSTNYWLQKLSSVRPENVLHAAASHRQLQCCSL